MTNTPRPYPRTAALVFWLFGDLSDDRQYRRLRPFMAAAGFLVGLLVVSLFPAWVSLLTVVLCLVGIVWLLRVAAAYSRDRP